MKIVDIRCTIYNTYYCKEVIPMSIEELTRKVKELTKLAKAISKLIVELISIVGWILILIQLFK